MKIAFDIDGSYTENPEMFDSLAETLQNAGHEVGFLTGRGEDRKIETEIPVGFEPDFEHYLGTDPDDPVQLRTQAKADTMREEGIDMTFDDEADWFPDYVTAIKV